MVCQLLPVIDRRHITTMSYRGFYKTGVGVVAEATVSSPPENHVPFFVRNVDRFTRACVSTVSDISALHQNL
jgi:hypothetical protein